MEYQSPDPYIEKKGTFYQCNLCASHLNSVGQVQSHIYGANHQSRLKAVKPVLQQAEANVNSTQQKFSTFSLNLESNLPQYVEKHRFGYKCACCDIPLNSDSQIMSHVAGAKHIKKATSFYDNNLISSRETKMEIENVGPPANDHNNAKMSSVTYNQNISNPVFSSDLPPYIERFEDQYKCECCNTILNSSSQIHSHVNGIRHIKTKLLYDANPALSAVKSDCGNLNGTKNEEESFDLYSNLKQINPDELMKSLKIIKANEAVIF
nr:zinc finger protein 346-like [Parasteatoda tepidariorum]XP_042899261.1 zinc finger protein 346-like [Parasteatoda tepidariorum]XP_042899262.1 zinc finger protein 346-like [Parasteatoda tepidariorum]